MGFFRKIFLFSSFIQRHLIFCIFIRNTRTVKSVIRFAFFWVIFLYFIGFLKAEKSKNICVPSSLQFTENKGQWNNTAKYVADLHGGKLVAEKNKLSFMMYDAEAAYEAHHFRLDTNVKAHLFNINFVNSNSAVEISSEEKEKTYRNYYLGNNPAHWASKVCLFKKISYINLWSGIDAKMFGSGDALKYEFVVHAHHSSATIQLNYEGVDDLKIEDGELRYKTSIGKFRELSPFAFQIVNGNLHEVKCNYHLNSITKTVSFSFPNGYDSNYDLVIDPTLVFSSYTGSTADNWGYTATYDNQGNMYVGGYVNCDYPDIASNYVLTPGAFQMTWGSGTGLSTTGNVGGGNGIGYACDMGITKFSADGTSIIYSTYLGGDDNDTPNSLVVDAQNNLIIYGVSFSANFPVSGTAYDATINGESDIVVTKFNSTGTALIGSTFVGGSALDGINYEGQEFTSGKLKVNYGDQNRGEINIDTALNIYVASCTMSSDFPATSSALQATFGGAQDGCAFKLNNDCSQLIWCTYIGGTLEDAAYSLDIGPSGTLYVAGGTMSTNFPTTAGSLHTSYMGGTTDGFLSQINSTGTALMSSSYIGTAGDDQVYFVKLDDMKNVYFMGQTTGAYPVFNATYSNPNSGQFISKVNPGLSSVFYSTVFGNGMNQPNISPTAFLVDTCENVYVAGWTNNSQVFNSGNCCPGFLNPGLNMPLTPDALQSTTDGTDFYFFVLKKNATAQLYGSYFGGNGIEHVDGGTSRFDKRGVMYEAICAGCGGTSFTPTQPGVWSPQNQSSNCNLLGLKIAFNLGGVEVTVDAHPRATGCVPLTVNFESTTNGTQQVLWNFDDNNSTSTLANPVYTYTDTGVYNVMLVGVDSNSCNLADTAYLEVYVRDDSLVANFLPNIVINCDSNEVVFVSHNYSTTFYHWDFGDGISSNLDSVAHQYPSTGNYFVTLIVIDTTKCNLEDTFTASIKIPPLINAVFVLNNSYGCIPLTVDFDAQQIAGSTYYWNFDDGTSDTARTTSHTFTTVDTFNVKLIVYDANSCNLTDTAFSIIITIDSSADADFHFNRIFYGCDSVEVIVWTTYIGADAQTWDFGDGTLFTNVNSASHTYSAGGTFTISHFITDFDVLCHKFDTSEIAISLSPVQIALSIADTSGCYPFTANFVATSNLLTTDYTWFFGDGNFSTANPVSHTYTNTGSFAITLLGIDTNACIQADSAFGMVTVINDSVHAAFQLNVLNDCDSNLVISLINQSTNAQQYFWSFGDSTFSSQQNENHVYHLPNTYTVTLIVQDTNRCHPLDTVSQTVILLPNLNVYFTTADVCLGTTVLFNNLSNPTSQFIWNFSDGNFSNQYSPSHDYTSTGNYFVQLVGVDTNTCNVRDTAIHNVIVHEQPVANFYTVGDTIGYEKPITFNNSSTDYTNLFWNFGDGMTASDEENPIHTYETVYGVVVCLTAVNGSCIDTFCKNIFISFTSLIGVPNAFSPNGDGINDVVYVEGKGIIELDFSIYNRWGEKVFESHNQRDGWNGIYKGLLQEMEVYTYAVTAVLVNGDNKFLKGNITLLR